MPIRPENKAKYSKAWPSISRHIRGVRANNQCECTGECGLHHGRRCEEKNGEKATWAKGKVILTVAHLDHDPTNNRYDNLKAMCNRCHLRYDKDHHQETRKKRSEDQG